MKKNIILFAALFISTAAFSQVGINTSTPEGVFHIDSKKNNNNIASTSTTVADDVVVSNTSGKEGNVGLGTKDPSVKLHITTGGTAATPNATGFRLEDGNQNTNFVLTSNSNGVGTWKPVAATRIVGIIGAGIDVPLVTTGGVYRKTGSYIDLPSGKWEVRVTMLMPVGGVQNDPLPGGGTMTASDWVWLKSTFSTVNAATITETYLINNPTTDIEGSSLVSNLFSGPKSKAGEPKFNMMIGSVIINNTSTASKRYYYYAGNTDSQEYTTGSGKATKFYLFGGDNWGENSITAVKVN